jgi:hypothetical protein
MMLAATEFADRLTDSITERFYLFAWHPHKAIASPG